MKHPYSNNRMLLFEILLNVLLFSVLVVIGLSFFLRAHTKTKETTLLHQAVNACTDAAAVFQSGDGTLAPLFQTYPYSADLDTHARIYLDATFSVCEKASAAYVLTATLLPAETEGLSKADLICSTLDGTVLYQIRVCHYSARTAAQPHQKEGMPCHNT